MTLLRGILQHIFYNAVIYDYFLFLVIISPTKNIFYTPTYISFYDALGVFSNNVMVVSRLGQLNVMIVIGNNICRAPEYLYIQIIGLYLDYGRFFMSYYFSLSFLHWGVLRKYQHLLWAPPMELRIPILARPSGYQSAIMSNVNSYHNKLDRERSAR